MQPELGDLHIIGQGTYQRLVAAERCPGLLGQGVAMSALSLCRRAFRRCQVRPALAQVLFVLDGQGEVLVGGAWRPAPAGTLYRCPPGLRRAARATADGWHIGWLDLAPGHGMPLPDVPTIGQASAEALAESMRLLWRECTRSAPDPLAISHLLPLLGLQVRRCLGGRGGRLDRLWQEIDADPAADWSLAAMARTVGVGIEQLRRLCRQSVGESPVAHLRRLRLDRAAALLRSTDLAVADVAAAVGYRDPTAFTAACTRCLGHSPRRLRRDGVS